MSDGSGIEFAVMALCPQHRFVVLTKRAWRMRRYIEADRMGFIEGRAKRIFRERSADPSQPALVGETLVGSWPWPHVILGVSVEDQATADERIPHLLATPAACRMVSAEPLLGAVDLTRICIVAKRPGSARAGIHVNALAGRYVESGRRTLTGSGRSATSALQLASPTSTSRTADVTSTAPAVCWTAGRMTSSRRG